MGEPTLSRRALLRAAAIGGLGVPLLSVSARAPGPAPAADPVSVAMHLHSSFSEGIASMAAHLDQARRLGVDVLFWTDHDFRVSAQGYRRRLGLAGPTDTEAGARVCAPLVGTPPGFACHTDADCTGKTTACTVGRCDPASGACWGQAIPDGTACSDGQPCSTGDACRSGVCLSQSDAACACVEIGDRACAPGNTCCGETPGCVDLESDVHNCGACGNPCGEGRGCVEGQCRVDPRLFENGLTDELTLSDSAASIPGADAITYDPLSVDTCQAYVSTYRTTSHSSVDIIDPGGTIQTFPFGPDFSPLNGVAVAKDSLLLADFVNTPGATAGLGVVDSAFGLIRRVAISATSGSGPFTDSRFNTGPVGPALDYVRFNSPGIPSTAWFGNWFQNGDLVRVEDRGPWTVFPEALWTTSTNRITAIAFEKRLNRTLAVPVKQRHLFIGHGTRLSRLNLDTGQRTDLDLANPAVYGGVAGILSIAVDPRSGDVLVEVKSSAVGASRFVLDISGHDDSVRNLADVQADLNVGPAIPGVFNFPNDTRLAIMPTGDLIRMITAVNAPPVFTRYGLPK